MAQPVWHLPRGVRAAAVILSLAGLVGGVRVLDARIAGIGEQATAAAVAPATIPVSIPEPMVVQEVVRQQAPTAMIVERVPAGDTHRFLMVDVTGYASTREQADESPDITAVGRNPRPGTVALSRDLLRTFTPGAPFSFGDRVLIPGMGVYVVEDTMNPRWSHKADIWFSDTATARKWGRRSVYITRINPGEPVLLSSAWHD